MRKGVVGFFVVAVIILSLVFVTMPQEMTVNETRMADEQKNIPRG